jgi:multicomponent Na+:H+ antiporter subunit C
VTVLPYVVATWLLIVGLWGAITSRHLVQMVICTTVAQSSSYVLLLAVGYRRGGQAPIVTTTVPPSSQFVDPLVQAMTLTDVVVEGTVAAVLLALTVQAHKRFGTADPDELGHLRG